MNQTSPTERLEIVSPPPRRTSRPLAGGLIAVSATLVLAVSAVGIVVAAPEPGAGQPVQVADIEPGQVAAHPQHLLAPPLTSPVLDAVAEPADTYEAEPPADALAIADFSVSNTQVLCNTQSPVPSHQYISFTWNVVGAEQVFFGVDTTDAQAEPMFTHLPHAGNSHTEFPAGYEEYTYACPVASHQYTLTAVDDQGHAVSRTVTVVNNGDTAY